jgi:hypothetical protein
MPYWTSLCVLRRTYRQSSLYETHFHFNILSKHHHHHHHHWKFTLSVARENTVSFSLYEVHCPFSRHYLFILVSNDLCQSLTVHFTANKTRNNADAYWTIEEVVINGQSTVVDVLLIQIHRYPAYLVPHVSGLSGSTCIQLIRITDIRLILVHRIVLFYQTILFDRALHAVISIFKISHFCFHVYE